MREVLRLTGLGTRREAVDFALREVVARHEQLGVLKLRGRIQWEGDPEVSRQGRVGEPRRSAPPRLVIVVDTSVWIDVLRGTESEPASRCVGLIEDGAPLALTDVILHGAPAGCAFGTGSAAR